MKTYTFTVTVKEGDSRNLYEELTLQIKEERVYFEAIRESNKAMDEALVKVAYMAKKFMNRHFDFLPIKVKRTNSNVFFVGYESENIVSSYDKRHNAKFGFEIQQKIETIEGEFTKETISKLLNDYNVIMHYGKRYSIRRTLDEMNFLLDEEHHPFLREVLVEDFSY